MTEPSAGNDELNSRTAGAFALAFVGMTLVIVAAEKQTLILSKAFLAALGYCSMGVSSSVLCGPDKTLLRSIYWPVNFVASICSALILFRASIANQVIIGGAFAGIVVSVLYGVVQVLRRRSELTIWHFAVVALQASYVFVVFKN